MSIVDLTQVLDTDVAPIRYDNFYLPMTFRVASISEPIRLTQHQIQGLDGVLQQEPFLNAKLIEITGRVFSGQITLDDVSQSCDSLIDMIRGVLVKKSDRRLYLDDTRYFNALLAGSKRDYVEDTNRGVADMTLQFIASDPYQYSVDLIEQTDSGVTALETSILTVGGNTETPLKFEIEITSSSCSSVRLNFYDDSLDPDGEPSGSMVLDSPGYSAGDSNGYYNAGDVLVIDSLSREITYIPSGGVGVIALHHVRSDEIDLLPVRLIPLLLDVGDTKVGYGPTDTGELEVRLSYRSRWV